MQSITAALVVVMFVCQLAVFVYRCAMFQKLKKKTFPNMVGLSAIATSVLFTAVAGILVFFTGNGVNAVCQVTVWACIVLYMSTKAQLYIFFIERMHIVHKSLSQTRKGSPLYIFNISLLIPFIALFVLMIYYRVAYVGEDQKCRHGLRRESTIPTVLYDTLFSVYSVMVFVWPLFKSQSLHRSDGLRWVVKKNIVGSLVSTISTLLNGFSLFYQEVQDTNNCLVRCTADVMVNVMVMNYLISGSGGNRKGRQDQLNYSASHYIKTSVADYHGYEVYHNNTSKVYPISESSAFSPMSTVLTTEAGGHLSTDMKQDSVIKESY